MNFIDIANIREVYFRTDWVEIPVGTEIITEGNAIHDGLLEFPNVFTNETESIIVPERILIQERHPNGTLKMNSLNILFTVDQNFSVAKNQKPKYISADLVHVPVLVATSSYDIFTDSGGINSLALSVKTYESAPKIKREKSYSIYFVVTAGSGYQAYTSQTNLKISMFYKIL